MVELTQAAIWHRQVAALAAAADRAGVAVDQLPTVRARLLTQQARFADAAARAGVAEPVLAPTPTEISAAAPALGDLSGETVAETFRLSYSTLDAVDSVLAGHLATAAPALPPAPTTPTMATPGPLVPAGAQVATPAAPPHLGTGAGVAGALNRPPGNVRGSGRVRNALVYGAYAAAVLVIQLVLLAVADEQFTLPLMAPLCLLVLPAFAWAAGWFTIGIAFRAAPGAPAVKRNPRLGVFICLLPDALFCAGLGALFLADQFGN